MQGVNEFVGMTINPEWLTKKQAAWLIHKIRKEATLEVCTGGNRKLSQVVEDVINNSIAGEPLDIYNCNNDMEDK